MNWVGGARNRIRQKQDKKKQQEYFERKRFEKKTAARISTSSQLKADLSQDLFFLQTLNLPLPSSVDDNYIKREPKMELCHKKQNKSRITYLPMSPITFDSKLQLIDINDCSEALDPEINTNLEDKEIITDSIFHNGKNLEMSHGRNRKCTIHKTNEVEQEFPSQMDMTHSHSKTNDYHSLPDTYENSGKYSNKNLLDMNISESLNFPYNNSTQEWESPSSYHCFKKWRQFSGSSKTIERANLACYDSPSSISSITSIDLQDRSFYSPAEVFIQGCEGDAPSFVSGVIKTPFKQRNRSWDRGSGITDKAKSNMGDLNNICDFELSDANQNKHEAGFYNEDLLQNFIHSKEKPEFPRVKKNYGSWNSRSDENYSQHVEKIYNNIFIINDELHLPEEVDDSTFKYCKQQIKPLVPISSMRKNISNYFKRTPKADINIYQEKHINRKNNVFLHKTDREDIVENILCLEDEKLSLINPNMKEGYESTEYIEVRNDNRMTSMTSPKNTDQETCIILEANKGDRMEHFVPNDDDALKKSDNMMDEMEDEIPNKRKPFREDYSLKREKFHEPRLSPEERDPDYKITPIQRHKDVQTESSSTFPLNISCAVQCFVETVNVSTQVQSSDNLDVIGKTIPFYPADGEDGIESNLIIISKALAVLKYLIDTVSNYGSSAEM